MERRAYADSTRRSWDGAEPRPLCTTIWYPAAAGSAEDTLGIGEPGAPLFVAGVVSPAAVNHHGNTAAEPHYDARGFLLWWERARDESVVLDRLLSDSLFGPHIDSRRVGAAGFLLGGYTVVALAGGRTDLDRFAAFCASPERDFTCEAQPELPGSEAAFDSLRASDPAVDASLARAGDSYRDDRIGAVVAIAPAVVQAFTPASLHAVRVPMLAFGGEADSVAPPSTNAATIAREVPGAKLILLPAARHYSFLSICTPLGLRKAASLCVDEKGLDREELHARVGAQVAEFFDTAFGGR